VNSYTPRKYWPQIAESYATADSAGFAPVLHPGAPPWFNKLIDKLQFRAVRRALDLAGISRGSRILDVGCGTGRWARRYKEFGLHVTGVDATPAMLRVAREQGTSPPLIAGEAHRLPFPSETFDCISDITVVQHIPFPDQAQALREMMRVLKPGGSVILMELIRGKGPHIFPRKPRDWIGEFASCGAKLVGCFGQEYLLLDRLFVTAVQTVTRKGRRSGDGFLPIQPPVSTVSPSRRAYWATRRVTVQLSTWVDLAAGKMLPIHFATHGVFVLRK
jgi:SAM-dependent methyltransferase